ncbi:MAG: TolB family protein [Phycisphaerae bacterium]
MKQHAPTPFIMLALAAAALVAPLVGCSQAGSGRSEISSDRGANADEQAAPRGGSAINAFGERLEADAPQFENRLLTNITQHTFSTVGRDFDPDLANQGQTLAFASTAHAMRPDIYYKQAEGYVVTQLTSDPADDVQPRFSPDAKRVAFCSNRTGNWDIWTVNLDGTNLMQLTRDGSDEIAPCWSPDGRQVAFCVWGKRSQQWEIWTLAVDQPGVRKFLAYGLFPDWSPEGSRIAFQRARQRGTRWFSVWTIDLVGSEARNPTEVAHSDSAAVIAPRWSPDGHTIVCCTVNYGLMLPDSPSEDHSPSGSDLWAVDVRSGVRQKLTDGAATAFNPVWSRDGRVYFVSTRAGVENIWSVAMAGGGEHMPPNGVQPPTDEQSEQPAAAVMEPGAVAQMRVNQGAEVSHGRDGKQ